MALSEERTEEAFDDGWEAAKAAAEQEDDPSLIAEIIEGVLMTIMDSITWIFTTEDDKEYKEHFERGARAYQRQRERD